MPIVSECLKALEECWPNNKTTKHDSTVLIVYNFWSSYFWDHHGQWNPKKTILNQKRRSKISARLKEGYSLDRIRKAVVGCSRSSFHMGQNDTGKMFTDISLICRDGSQIERFESMFDDRPLVRGTDSDPVWDGADG